MTAVQRRDREHSSPLHAECDGATRPTSPRPEPTSRSLGGREMDVEQILPRGYRPPLPISALRSAPAGSARGAKAADASATKPPAATPGDGVDAAKPRSRAADGLLYVGLNPDSQGKEGAFLTGLAHTSRVAHDATVTADLATAEGVDRAVAGLGLTRGVAGDVREALLRASPSERGELMQIAHVWSKAYQGEDVPSRLVLSGHSTGDFVFGETHGYRALQFESVRALAKAMPQAASRVEDIQFAACFTYRQISTDEKRAPWLEAFPGLKTMWGYASKSPLAPLEHLRQWERGTRGASDRVTSAANQLPPGVATWDVTHGYRGNVESKEQLLARKRADDAQLAALLDGRVALDGHYDPRADLPYQTCRKLEGRPDLSAEERAAMKAQGDRYLRLRMYDSTRVAFADSEQGTLAAGYAALGRSVPPYGELDRRQACTYASRALREIGARLDDAGRPPSPAGRAALERLRESLQGFLRLDRDY